MTTRPWIPDARRDAALSRIVDRRIAMDDEGFLHVEHGDVRRVRNYLRRALRAELGRSDRRTSGEIQADVADLLLLDNWLWWDGAREELAALELAVDSGMPKQRIGLLRGTGRQGVSDRIDALRALLEHHRPDVKLTREARRAEREKPSGPDDLRLQWLKRHHDWISDVAAALLEHGENALRDVAAHAAARQGRRAAADDVAPPGETAAEWLVEVRYELAKPRWLPTGITIMAMAVDELRSDPDLADLPGQHLLMRACAEFDQVQAAYADLSGALRAKPERRPRVTTPRRSTARTTARRTTARRTTPRRTAVRKRDAA